MDGPKRAVIFFEEDREIPEGGVPLALERLQGRPVLFWMGRELSAEGVERFFAAAPPRFAPQIRACFPAGAEVAVSDRHEALMDFLDTEEDTAVFSRAAVPAAAAGPGFAYAAPGSVLRETWRLKMTSAVQEARLLSGWVPLYGRETLAEMEPIFQEQKAP